MGRLRLLVTLVAAAAVGLSTYAPPVAATSPGTNGLIAFVSSRDGNFYEISAMRPDGTGQTNLTNTSDFGEWAPSFSADGSRIAYTDFEAIGIWVMNADGTGQTDLGVGPFTSVFDPSWSPDGSRLVYVMCTDTCGPFELRTVNADGSGDAPLLSGDVAYSKPVWSPDGTQIAFVYFSFSTSYGIAVINADGSGRTTLTDGVSNVDGLSWSPDGTRLAYSVYGSGISVMNTDGTSPTYLGLGSNVTWSPDGTQMAYTCGTYPDDQICVMNADGSGAVPLTTQGRNFQPSWGANAAAGYAFTGFFAPVDNAALNVAKAGSAIPVKFSLGGDQGLDIFADGYPKAVPIACDTGEPFDTIETYVVASNSGLKYSADADQYTYVWKTQKGWTGCQQLQVKLDDGTTHTADFKFR